MTTALLVLFLLVVLFVVVMLAKTVRIVPQARAAIVERFGKYKGTLPAGLNIVVPFIDKVRYLIDLREQVVSFPPQPVITRDNLVVSIDTVIYFQVTDARAATYEVANYITAVEKQMRADRDKRAAILSAEGSKQSAILTAEGERQAAVLKARGESEAVVLRAEAEATAQAARARGQAEAISTVFKAIHEGNPDQRLLAYQYTTVLSLTAKVDPCHGQVTQTAPRSVAIRPWWRGPPRWEHRSDSTLTPPACRYTSRDR